MFEFRVTKYDPTLRGQDGAYLRDDWISVSDIEQSFEGKLLTSVEYQRIENAYVKSALAFLRESGEPALTVRGLEHHNSAPLSFSEGTAVAREHAEAIVRCVLREEFWCKLEAPDFFIHIGYDYYMYVGVAVDCPNARALAVSLGLFVEPFQSPYVGSDTAYRFIQAQPAARVGLTPKVATMKNLLCLLAIAIIFAASGCSKETQLESGATLDPSSREPQRESDASTKDIFRIYDEFIAADTVAKECGVSTPEMDNEHKRNFLVVDRAVRHELSSKYGKPESSVGEFLHGHDEVIRNRTLEMLKSQPCSSKDAQVVVARFRLQSRWKAPAGS